jgi:hypothetical protein
VLQLHVEAAMKRAQQAGFCLVIHDTTDIHFNEEREREGLGLLSQTGAAFLGTSLWPSCRARSESRSEFVGAKEQR